MAWPSLTGHTASAAALRRRRAAVFTEPVTEARAQAVLAGLSIQPGDDPLTLSLSVPRDQFADAAGRLLQLGSMADLSIAEVPVEDIVRDIFGGVAAGSGGQ